MKRGYIYNALASIWNNLPCSIDFKRVRENTWVNSLVLTHETPLLFPLTFHHLVIKSDSPKASAALMQWGTQRQYRTATTALGSDAVIYGHFACSQCAFQWGALINFVDIFLSIFYCFTKEAKHKVHRLRTALLERHPKWMNKLHLHTRLRDMYGFLVNW